MIPVPNDTGIIVIQHQFEAVALVSKKHSDAVRTVRMMDAELAVKGEVLSVRGEVYPRLLDPGAVGEIIPAIGCVGRTVDVGIVKVKIAVEAISVGKSDTAFTDGAFKIFTDHILELPAAFVNRTFTVSHTVCKDSEFLYFCVTMITAEQQYREDLTKCLLETATGDGFLKGTLLETPDLDEAWLRYAPFFYGDSVR